MQRICKKTDKSLTHGKFVKMLASDCFMNLKLLIHICAKISALSVQQLLDVEYFL